MVEYDVKRGWSSKIEDGELEKLMRETFGNVEVKGNIHTSKFGVLEKIEVEILSKTSMRLETTNSKGPMEDDDILNTKRKLNVFIEAATGFDVKARKKRAQDKIKKGIA